MDQDVGNYIAAHTPLSPVIQGRITCIHGAGPLSANACPTPNP
jgi:hypothetical protein